MVQFLDAETAEILQFLDPEIVEMDQKKSGSRNHRNGAVSGCRNSRYTAVSGSINCRNGGKNFWIQKPQIWCDFWIHKQQKRSTNPLCWILFGISQPFFIIIILVLVEHLPRDSVKNFSAREAKQSSRSLQSYVKLFGKVLNPLWQILFIIIYSCIALIFYY